MRPAFFALASIVAATALAGTASAYVIVAGGGFAATCYESARDQRATARALDQCTIALSDLLSSRDRAGTYVNRGIIYMRRGSVGLALSDFDAAIRLQPDLAEGYINRGAALLVRNDLEGAIAAIDQGLQHDPEQPALAYYNRGIANEDLGRLREAYRDYRRASELAPDWDAPRAELARFRVG